MVLMFIIIASFGAAVYFVVDAFISSDVDVLGSALSSGDISDCSLIGDDVLRSSCVSSISISQAIQSDDVNVCSLSNNIPGCEYAFYVHKAKTLGDISYCSFTDASRCSDEYYLNSAVTSKDKFKCGFIVDSNIRKICEAI